MKICYVTMGYPAPSEAFATVDIRALQKMSHLVSVACFRTKPKRHGELHGSERVSYLSVMTLFQFIRQAILRPKLVAALLPPAMSCRGKAKLHALLLIPRAVEIYAQIERDRADVVHLFWGHFPSLVGILVGRFLPKVRLTQFLGAYDLGRKLPISLVCAQYASHVVTHAEVNRQDLLDFGIPAAKLAIIHRGTVIPNLPLTAKDPNLYVAAGRLIPAKGFDKVITWFATLAARDQRARLVIAGDGPQRAHLETLASSLGIEGRVEFTGHLKQEEFFEWLNRAMFFVLFSHKPYERLPNVVKEAMARACVCIVQSTPGMGELIPSSEYGFLVDDPFSFLREIQNSTADKLAAIGKNARTFIEQHFNADLQMQKYVDIWKAAH